MGNFFSSTPSTSSESSSTPSRVCASCNQVILGTVMTMANGHFYHKHHFRCSRCSTALSGKYQRVGQDVVCLDCYNSGTCDKCQGTISSATLKGGAVETTNHLFHRQCFHCDECNVDLDGERVFVVSNKDGTVGTLCATHKPSGGGRKTTTTRVRFVSKAEKRVVDTEEEEGSAGLCPACRKPAGPGSGSGDCVVALDRRWHVACFTCSECEIKLVGRQFWNAHEKLYCRKCYPYRLMSLEQEAEHHALEATQRKRTLARNKSPASKKKAKTSPTKKRKTKTTSSRNTRTTRAAAAAAASSS